jgi:DNA processing protein
MHDAIPWIALGRVPGMSRALAHLLLQRFGTPAAIFAAGEARLRAHVPPSVAARLAHPPLEQACRELERAEALGLRVLVPGDAEFPGLLRAIPDPPLVLYARGSLPAGPALAVVGSRRASARAREVARAWSASLATAGVWIVSGLAYGVDAAAHRGALEAGGLTLAVLASGLDRPSPAGNVALAGALLAAGGGWLSEHPPGVPALAHHFPERNRLISGIASATWVVEARERSGSLWSARHALDQGREVFATPGPVDTDLCRGSNALLRDGAGVALEPADLELALLGSVRGREPPALAGPGHALRALLRAGPVDVDRLGEALGLGSPALAALLLELELEGAIAREGTRVRLRARLASVSRNGAGSGDSR